MRINVIAAVAKNLGIGLENKLLYWLTNDLKRFKALTTGRSYLVADVDEAAKTVTFAL